jgi:hypothetical protein
MNGNEATEKALSFCADCLKDLQHPRDKFIECCACGQFLCDGCTLCVCERIRPLCQ